VDRSDKQHDVKGSPAMNSHHDIRCTLPGSLWAESASPAPLTTSIQGQLSASVVIIGGGFTGLSTDLHLAEKGVDVIVLEAQETGFGGSGRNVGLVNADLWVTLTRWKQH